MMRVELTRLANRRWMSLSLEDVDRMANFTELEWPTEIAINRIVAESTREFDADETAAQGASSAFVSRMNKRIYDRL